MLEETWSIGCCTRRVPAVGADAADSHSWWWRWRCCRWCCVQARLGTIKYWPCISMDGNVSTVQVWYEDLLHSYGTCTVHVFFPTRNNQVLACVMDRPVHTRTRTRGTQTTHTRIQDDHTCNAVVHIRTVVVSVAIRPRKAWSGCCWCVACSQKRLQQWLTSVFSITSLGSTSAESNPVITYQILRLWTPRARATEPARDRNLCRRVHASPLRTPQPRARRTTHGCRRKACQCPNQNTFIVILLYYPNDHYICW